jgi:uncharacterized Zn finger protein (UPF0148 family)
MSADLSDIPPEAFCRVCGEPMKVVRYEDEARAMGFKVPHRGIPSIECHDRQLVIEDDDVAQELMKRLETYHAAKALEESETVTHQLLRETPAHAR